jgi:metal-responsive CopG/Arc/MetJ family transcriptional regulator
MAKTKIAVTLESKLVEQLDALVAGRRYTNRSQFVEAAVAERLERAQRTRLVHECAKLDPNEEKSLAEEGMRR